MDNRTKKILVVEDDPYILDGLKEVLETESFEVSCALNGLKAMELLKTMSPLPALILLDHAMPEMDGYGFSHLLRLDERLAHIPIVLVTADGHSQEKAEKVEAKAVLRKPVDIDDMLKTVHQYAL